MDKAAYCNNHNSGLKHRLSTGAPHAQFSRACGSDCPRYINQSVIKKCSCAYNKPKAFLSAPQNRGGLCHRYIQRNPKQKHSIKSRAAEEGVLRTPPRRAPLLHTQMLRYTQLSLRGLAWLLISATCALTFTPAKLGSGTWQHRQVGAAGAPCLVLTLRLQLPSAMSALLQFGSGMCVPGPRLSVAAQCWSVHS